METVIVKAPVENLQDIADIMDIDETSPVNVKDLMFTYGYFTELPELVNYIDSKILSDLRNGIIQCVQFVELD